MTRDEVLAICLSLPATLELREMYPGIRPGYHRNQRHWNTVDLVGSVENDVVCGLISDSYDLVVAGLPLSIRAGLAAD
jgi:predicted DNA-binding protein (MmcQ/YjbR family)